MNSNNWEVTVLSNRCG